MNALTGLAMVVGALLGFFMLREVSAWIPAILDILPHIFEEAKQPGRAAAFILGGILAFFVLEKMLLWRHHHHGEEGVHEHDHGRSGWMIVVGDSFHNFTDGVIIAGAFVADEKVGVVTALAIIAHEIPQEIGDFLVLLHSGFDRRRALLMNALTGLAMVVGALLGFFMLREVSAWIPEILAIAAASMIYVAVADLIPGLHRRTAVGESLMQVAFIALGIGLIWYIHASLFPHG